MHVLAASAALALAQPRAVAAFATPVRVIRVNAHTPRYLRMRSRVHFAGVTGDCVTVFDFRTGRIAERVAAGVLSYSDGFDGHRAWSADMTGMPVIEGNAETLADLGAWGVFLGAPEREHPGVQQLRSRRGSVVLRLRYRLLSEPIDVTLDAKTRYVRRIDDGTGGELDTATFDDYRSEAGIVLPHLLRTRSRYGDSREAIGSVEAPASIPDADFNPPAPPHDVSLDRVASVPMRFADGTVSVSVRLNDGPVLHMLLDSGSSNFLTFAAARRLGLTLRGEDKTGGVGPGTVRERYTAVRSVRLGRAVMRDQPFQVIDYAEKGIDGALGCETFERFVVRFDFAHRSIVLAPRAEDLGMLGVPMRMRLSGCTPEVDGAIDGVAGPLMLDTGSAVTLDVLTPAVRRNRLLTRYAAIEKVGGGGIGGETRGVLVRAHSVRLGSVALSEFRMFGRSMRGIPIVLQTTSQGALSSTSELGNVGTLILEMFSPTFDFAAGRLWLLPTGT